MLQPESALSALFGNSLSLHSAEVAAQIGVLTNPHILLRLYATLAVPVAVALASQAVAAHSGHLACDSSMRLNFGILLQAALALAAIISSPMHSVRAQRSE